MLIHPFSARQGLISCKPFPDELNTTVLILMGIYMGGALAGMLRAWLFVLAGQKLVARLRKKLFTSVIQQEVAFFDQNR